MKIHHIGIATNDVDSLLKVYKLKRDDIAETVFDNEQKNNLHFIFLKENNLWIEIIEPVDKTSTISNFVNKNQSALHHIGISTDNIEHENSFYSKLPSNFIIGKYRLTVNSFGGKIKTLFVAFKGMITEFVQ
tara:strand:- start:222 stop:617 length:396 start_codon:yes stop_codon:yes gene_type:complete